MNGTLTVEIRAGALLRGTFMRELKSVCFHHNLYLDYTEHKGLLSTTYFITIEGKDTELLQVKDWIEHILKQFSD